MRGLGCYGAEDTVFVGVDGNGSQDKRIFYALTGFIVLGKKGT